MMSARYFIYTVFFFASVLLFQNCSGSFDVHGTDSSSLGNTGIDSSSGDGDTDPGSGGGDKRENPPPAVLLPPAKGSPIVFYTDALSGPTSGGENNQGAYLSIFGKNFGNSLSNVKVYIGGKEVANYRFLGLAKTYTKTGMQQLAVQVGSLAGATLGVALPIKVVVGSLESNTNHTFTPNPGRILFVSLAGNDSTALPGDITKPYRHLQTSSGGGAYGDLRAGDHIVIRGGHWTDTGVDGAWLRFRYPQQEGSLPTGAALTGWMHITAYPGPINGTAMEDVYYTTQAGTKGGIHGANSAYYGTTGDYVSISNLRIDIDAGATSDAAPFNEQYGKGPWRVVNNEGGPWPSRINSKAAGYSGHGDGTKVLGNHFHHMHCIGALENHGIYIDSGGRNIEIAYNYIHDITGGNLIQFFDNVGLAGNNYANMPSNWFGFANMLVHHNWLENSAKYGLNMADGLLSGKVWNNVIIGAAFSGLRINTISQNMDMTFAFNTFYDNDRVSSGSGNAQILNTWGNYNPTGTIRIYNNIFVAGSRTTNSSSFYENAGDDDNYLDVRNNLYFDNGYGWSHSSIDNSGIYGNPQFTSITNADFSLQLSSPAIGTATQALPSGMNVTDDFTLLISRPQNGASDLGAFEKE